tara:strand:+ start:1848 stop:2561 length:714 start_codon:yes stop_codon:yes gene_type:complete
MTVKGLLLSAGLGTRLRPLTLNTPKCLVSIGGRILLDRWLSSLEEIGCSETIVNTHYLSEKVEAFLLSRKPSRMKIVSKHEEQLLGTAGTLLENKNFFKNSTVLLIHADNITNFNLSKLIECHRSRPSNCLLTMLTFETNNPSQCGIVKTNSDGIVVDFVEKSSSPPGNCANGAIYCFDYELITFLERLGPDINDFSNQVIPSLIGKIKAFHTNEIFLDIGTPESLDYAQKIWTDQN